MGNRGHDNWAVIYRKESRKYEKTLIFYSDMHRTQLQKWFLTEEDFIGKEPSISGRINNKISLKFPVIKANWKQPQVFKDLFFF